MPFYKVKPERQLSHLNGFFLHELRLCIHYVWSKTRTTTFTLQWPFSFMSWCYVCSMFELLSQYLQECGFSVECVSFNHSWTFQMFLNNTFKMWIFSSMCSFMCFFTDMMYELFSHLQQIRHLSENIGMRPCACKYCDKVFKKLFNLNDHERIHSDFCWKATFLQILLWNFQHKI